jgi:hypothetical protein
MKNLMHTLYMGMKTQSSSETRKRARDLSEAIGSYHLEADIDRMFNACKDISTESTGFEPNFAASSYGRRRRSRRLMRWRRGLRRKASSSRGILKGVYFTSIEVV